MQIFKLILNLLSAVGIEARDPAQDHSLNWKSVMAFFLLSKYALLTVVAVCLEDKTFSEYAEFIYSFLTSIAVVNNVSIALVTMKSLYILVVKIEDTIANRSQNPASKKIYEQTNEKIENTTKTLIFVCDHLTLVGSMVPHLMISYFQYFTTDLGSEAFQLPYPEWSPPQCKTPIGYFIMFLLQFASFFYMTHMLAYNLGIFIGACWMFLSFATDIKNEWSATKDLSKLNENHRHFKQKVNRYVEFHTTAVQYVSDFSDAYQGIIFDYFLWSLLTICGTLLLVQMELENNGITIELIRPLMLIFWSFCPIFIFCNLGENVSTAFGELNNALYQSDWYEFPVEVQRMLPLLLVTTQKQVVPRGFGNLFCLRQSFQKVANGGASYFLTFRRFGQ